MNATPNPSSETHPQPSRFRRYRVALVLTVALGALLIPSAVYFYTHDGGGSDRITTLDLGWASPKVSEACTYDKAAEQMTLRLRLNAQTTRPVDVIATGMVTRHGDGGPEKYTGKTKVTVDGTRRQDINVTVDVPADAYAKGYVDCRLSLGYNRGEPWD